MHHLTSNLHYFHYEKVMENYKELNKLLKQKTSTKKTKKLLNLLTEIIESKDFLGIDVSSDEVLINDLKNPNIKTKLTERHQCRLVVKNNCILTINPRLQG